MSAKIGPKNTAGIVLTGGKSTRMGRDKALLTLGGRALWQIAADTLAPLVDTVLLVGEVEGFLPPPAYSLYPDVPTGCGPLGGIATGLEASGYTHNLVLAVDHPFVRPALLALLLERAEGRLAVCGRSESHVEPLIGYYHSQCAPVIREMLRDGDERAHMVFEKVPSLVLDPAELSVADPKRVSYLDLDSPDDLANALLMGF